MPGTIALLGTFDTKKEELLYIGKQMEKHGLNVLMIDISCLKHIPLHSASYSPIQVANAAGMVFEEVSRLPRYEAAQHMSRGASLIMGELLEGSKIQGCFGIGGANGTSMFVEAVDSLPLGFPKVIVSVLAAVDARWLISHTDICLFNSIGDVVKNPVMDRIIDQAVLAICGMSNVQDLSSLPDMVGITVLGVTDQCVENCRKYLDEQGFPSMLLHSNGPGGATLERMVSQGYFWGVLDVTTNELINNIVGGVFDAGPYRLETTIKHKLPLVVSTGAVDFVNFWGGRVPAEFEDHLFIRHSTQNVLMRTSVEENRKLGQAIAKKLNRANSPVRVVIPSKGFSKYDQEGGTVGTDLNGNEKGLWYSPEANLSFSNSLQENLNNPLVQAEIVDAHINDSCFSRKIVKRLIDLRSMK